MESNRNTKRIALVTGANKGIGQETARQLAAAGMTVLVGARDRDRGEAAVARLRAASGGEDVHLVVVDVADDASVSEAARRIESDFGRLDVLVNNAAIAAGSGPPGSQTLAGMRAIYATNVLGALAMTQALLPLLRQAPDARIVNVSSSLGSLALAADPATPVSRQGAFFAYSSSKTALNAFTVRLASELRDSRIKVNSACPGYVATDLNQHQGVRTVEQGAKIIVRLASLPDDGPTGGFFDDAGPVPW